MRSSGSFPASHVGGNRAHGAFEFAARAVVHREIEDQTGILRGLRLQIVSTRRASAREALANRRSRARARYCASARQVRSWQSTRTGRTETKSLARRGASSRSKNRRPSRSRCPCRSPRASRCVSATMPRRCPSSAGKPCSRAQRRLPSMMIATCRGTTPVSITCAARGSSTDRRIRSRRPARSRSSRSVVRRTRSVPTPEPAANRREHRKTHATSGKGRTRLDLRHQRQIGKYQLISTASLSAPVRAADFDRQSFSFGEQSSRLP